jgi:hypothetical protein
LDLQTETSSVESQNGAERDREKESRDLPGVLSSIKFLALDAQTLALQRIPKTSSYMNPGVLQTTRMLLNEGIETAGKRIQQKLSWHRSPS